MQKTTAKKDSTVTKLKNILLDFFVEESIMIIDDKMIICPTGTFSKEEGEWGFDIDFSYMTDTQDTISLMYLLQNISNKKIDLIFFMGHHTIFNDDDICCGCVFEQDIDEYIEKNKCFYEEALEDLSNELIEEYAKEMKVKENVQ
jgi:hypothetical protein